MVVTESLILRLPDRLKIKVFCKYWIRRPGSIKTLAEKLASTMVDLLTAGVFDDVPEVSRFAELSQSRIGYAADVSLASWLVDELEQRGLARPSEDGVSIPLHPVVRQTILVLLGQLARLRGVDSGLSISPTTNLFPVVDDLLRLLSHESLPSASNIVAFDLQPVTLDLELVPLDEVLGYREENQNAHRAYMRDVRRFATDLACAADTGEREELFQKRREEISAARHELRRSARKAFGKNLAAWSFGLAGSWWSLAHSHWRSVRTRRPVTCWFSPEADQGCLPAFFT